MGKHNFHFVLNGNLKEKIEVLSSKLNLSKSNTVIYILNETLCILSKYQFNLQEDKEDLNYKKIDWDSDLHVYMGENLYRKIRHLTDSVFSFSMAIIIRKLIELYFKILERSNGNINKVRKIFKRFYSINVKKYGTSLKKWNKKIIDKQLSGKFYYSLEFNDKFSIIGFDFNATD